MKKGYADSIVGFLKTLAESILPLFFWIFLIFGFDIPYIAILTIISALIHEMGHITAILCLRGEYEIPTGRIFGFRIRRRDSLSYKSECILLAAGPIMNLAVFLVCFPFRTGLGGYIGMLGLINLATALSNLIPVEGYDGYGILEQILTSRNLMGGLRVLECTSFLFSVAASFISLYLIDKADAGYWIFAVFFAMMISKLKKYGKYDVF